MKQQKKIKKGIIAIDSMIFIYHFEAHLDFVSQTREIFRSINIGKNKGISSIISLLEILTHPKKKKNYLLVKEYSELLNHFPNLRFIDVDWKIVDLASSLRAKYNLKTPDSIQIATAITEKADYFITADKNFKKVEEIKVKLIKSQ